MLFDRYIIATLSALILLCTPEILNAQDTLNQKEHSNNKLFRQSKKHANAGEPELSRAKLIKLVERNPDNFNYNYELGLNYYYTFHRKEEALPYFEKAVKNSPKDTIGELFYYLGDLYQHKGELEKAIENYTIMKQFVKNNKPGKELFSELNFRIAQCFGGKAFAVAVDKKVKVENMGSNINSKFPDYAPVINNEEHILMFTSRRSSNLGGKIDYRDDKFFEDMYLSRKEENGFSPAQKFLVSDKYVGLIPNSPKHDAVVGFSSDEQKLFTFRDNSLWVSHLTKEGIWQGPEKLNENINSNKGYQPHACISSDGKTMFFSSERKGGLGGLDLYSSTLQEDGTWGIAKNIGAEINTKYNEDSPFISEDGKTLYFSSKGHNTIGGYDIFYTHNINGSWTKPVNLGRPVNSMADDIFYNPVKVGNQAYFSSSRPDGLGDMDIYRITYLTEPEFKDCNVITQVQNDSPNSVKFINFTMPDTILKGDQVFFDASQSRVKDSEIGNDVFWLFADGSTAKEVKTTHTFENTGVYEIKMELQAFHKIKLTTDNYCISKFIHVVEKVKEPLLAVNNPKNNSKEASNDDNKVGAIVGEFVFENVYYDFDKGQVKVDSKNALDKNIAILKANPDVKIKIIAYADSKGSLDYNIRLSKKRANEAAQYLILKGISAKRIQAIEGKGEANLVNKCADGVECTPEEHQLNRRAEFIVVGN
ncbi:MAG: PD40 domain-containing protein [Bacteroidetes bacterium]|nr:PD40 domain-containing protein [Bacteroidota bacterium]HET6245245.1 OmpA family protein [Bacteroidia bacterium]